MHFGFLGFWYFFSSVRRVSVLKSALNAHQLIGHTLNKHIYDGFPTSPFGTDCTARLVKPEAVVILRKRGLCVLPVDSTVFRMVHQDVHIDVAIPLSLSVTPPLSLVIQL